MLANQLLSPFVWVDAISMLEAKLLTRPHTHRRITEGSYYLPVTPVTAPTIKSFQGK